MAHRQEIINAIVLHRGPHESRFTIGPDDDVGEFIADMILTGFRAGPLGPEFHMYGPAPTAEPLPVYKPIRSVSDLKTNRWTMPDADGPKVVPPAPGPVQSPENRQVPLSPTVVPLPGNVVSLAEFRSQKAAAGPAQVPPSGKGAA